MTEILSKYQFTYHHGCHCGGVAKKYYRRSEYEVMVIPIRKRWKLRKLGKTIADGLEGDLENKLKEL